MSDADEVMQAILDMRRIHSFWAFMPNELRAEFNSKSQAELAAEFDELTDRIEKLQVRLCYIEAELQMRALRNEVKP